MLFLFSSDYSNQSTNKQSLKDYEWIGEKKKTTTTTKYCDVGKIWKSWNYKLPLSNSVHKTPGFPVTFVRRSSIIVVLYMYAAFEEVNSGSVRVKPFQFFYGLAQHQPRWLTIWGELGRSWVASHRIIPLSRVCDEWTSSVISWSLHFCPSP